jgi:hypothetical protein
MVEHGATVPIQSMKACVIYDMDSGEIHHRHSAITLVGGREPTEEEIAAEARRALKNRRDQPVSDLEVLHVDYELLKADKRYRVDLESKTLVPDE